jgi:hypothetical protein
MNKDSIKEFFLRPEIQNKKATFEKVLMYTLNNSNRFAGQRQWSTYCHSLLVAEILVSFFDAIEDTTNSDGLSFYYNFFTDQPPAVIPLKIQNLKAQCYYHDIEEAITGDVISPIKKFLAPEIKENIEYLRQVITLYVCNFECTELHPLVHIADHLAFIVERTMVKPFSIDDILGSDRRPTIEASEVTLNSLEEYAEAFASHVREGIVLATQLFFPNVSKERVEYRCDEFFNYSEITSSMLYHTACMIEHWSFTVSNLDAEYFDKQYQISRNYYRGETLKETNT